jgi:hypothetical protein
MLRSLLSSSGLEAENMRGVTRCNFRSVGNKILGLFGHPPHTLCLTV